jgi:hypothetical protein
MGGGLGTSESVAGKGGVLGTRVSVARQEGGGTYVLWLKGLHT